MLNDTKSTRKSNNNEQEAIIINYIISRFFRKEKIHDKIKIMKIKIITESPKETQKIAEFFVAGIEKYSILKNKAKNQALVISLEGNLGSGKTEFLKGVAKSLSLKDRIFSPTFLIMKSYSFSSKKTFLANTQYKTLWHLDCYRLTKANDAKALGLEEIIKDAQNIIFIEWGNKIKKFLPQRHIVLKFKILKKDKRQLEILMP